MKLSEAIRLGRLLLSPAPGMQNDGRGSGCAIGMGLKACSIPVSTKEICVDVFPTEVETFESAFQAWPWLAHCVLPPCACSYERKRTIVPTTVHAIAHLFDQHVCGFHDWTLDQLVAWIESIEPTTVVCKDNQYEVCSGPAKVEQIWLDGEQQAVTQ